MGVANFLCHITWSFSWVGLNWTVGRWLWRALLLAAGEFGSVLAGAFYACLVAALSTPRPVLEEGQLWFSLCLGSFLVRAG